MKIRKILKKQLKKNALKKIKEIKGITVKEEIEIEKIVIAVSADSLGFTSDETTIKPKGKIILHRIADILRDHPDEGVLIAGHTNGFFDTPQSREISRKRAESVRNYYVKKEGLPAVNFGIVGYGASIPIPSGEIFGGKVKANRVETILTAEKPIVESFSKKKIDSIKTMAGVGVSRKFIGLRTKIIASEEAIHFDFDSSNIKKEDHPTLDKIANLLKINPEYKITINGYTDNIGPKEYNRILPVRRAKGVVNYFTNTKHNIPLKNFETKGYGEIQPITSNHAPEGRARNRRVVIVVNEISKQSHKNKHIQKTEPVKGFKKTSSFWDSDTETQDGTEPCDENFRDFPGFGFQNPFHTFDMKE